MPFASQSDAHREWHLNSGVPMGQPGCPQDACHPVYEGDEPEYGIKCGNRAVHGAERFYHYSVAEVRECFLSAPSATVESEPEVMLNRFGHPMHETPCVCGPYDRCRGVRAENAAASGNWRDRFRAYND